MVDAVEEYTKALRNLRDFSVVATTNELTRQNIIESLSPILQELGREGLWPDIGPLKGLRGSRVSRGNNIPALGELIVGLPGSAAVSSARDGGAEIIELSRKRLIRLRQLFEDALLKEEAAFDRQVKLTKDNRVTLGEIREAVRWLPTDYDRERVLFELPYPVRKCFPLENEDLRLSSLLRYIKAEHGGHFRLQDLPYGLQRVVATCGGTARVMSYLEGGSRALMSAYMLVSIDSLMNIQPCDDLPADPFVGRAKHGRIQLRTISSIKNRAGYKPVDGNFLEVEAESDEKSVAETPSEGQLPIHVEGAKISGAKAIEIWQKLSRPQRDRAKNAKYKDAEYLWIIRNGHDTDDVRRYEASSWKHWWNEFLDEHADDPVIGGLPIQRRMIRTTGLQLQSVHHGGDSEVVAMIANHSRASVTERYYTNRNYLRRLLDNKMREFLKLFEARLAGDRDERAAQLSLPLSEFKELRQTAVATGLGFDCDNPLSGYQPGTKDKICTRLDACSSCPLLRFVPSRESIRNLILFMRSLESSEEEFVSRNVSRWIRVWMPAMALCMAIIQLLKDGAKKRMVIDAENDVASGIASGKLILFRPW